MTHVLRGILVALVAFSACGGKDSGNPPSSSPPPSGTGGAPAGTGGAPAGTGGTIPGTGGAISGTGGSGDTGGTGGSATGGTGGASGKQDGSAPAGGTGGAGGGGGGGKNDGGVGDGPSAAPVMGHPGSLGFYEAETAQVTGRATRPKCKACPSTAEMKAGDSCCSSGGQVDWLVAHGNGEVQFNNVMIPSDGMYDVTWWYYCGNNDNFGDKNCGGQTNPPTMAAGCRPQQFYVNNALLPGAYHFPCFGGAWSIVRTATTTMAFKAGVNVLRLHAPPPRDAVNLDGIEIYPAGKGLAPTITSTMDLTGH